MAIICSVLVVSMMMGLCAIATPPDTDAVPRVPKDAGTAYVAQNVSEQHPFVSLLTALNDQRVGSIVIFGNYSVHQELNGFLGPPLVVSRNVTISGFQDKDTVLDLDFKRAMVELSSNSTLTFTNITIANERRGTGSQYDLFIGQPGSKVIARDVYKLRMACTTSRDLANIVSHTPRSNLFPGADKKQSFEFVNAWYHGHLYSDTLKMIDYTTDVPKTLQEGAPSYGGYALSESDKLRLCQRIVSQECLDRASPDYCVNRAIDEVEAEAAAATAAPQSQATAGPAAGGHAASQPPTAAIVAVGAIIGVVGSILAIGLALCLRRRQRRKYHQALLSSSSVKPAHITYFGGTTSTGSGNTTDDIEAGVDQEVCVESDAWQPSGLRKGWEVSHCLSTPLLAAHDNDDKVQFGRLLGCGSFGRVYHAKWAGRQCAVKVIAHGSNTTPVVENEVALMMAFNHPNIVRAYRCITYTHASSTDRVGTTQCGSTTDSAVEDSNYSSSLGPGLEGQGSRGLVRAVGLVRKQSSFLKDQTVFGASRNIPTTSGPRGKDKCPGAAPHSPDQQQPAESLAAEGCAAAAADASSTAAASRSPSVVQAASHASGSSLGRGVISHGSASSITHTPAAGQQGAGGGHLTGTAGTGTGTDFGSTDAEDIGRAETWLIQEFCDCGTLSSLLSKWQAPADSDERLVRLLVLLQDTARGLEELHKANVVHGDLNARNVLVSSSLVATYGHTAKIADLGLSRTVKQHQTHRTTNTVGTMSHMPPEMLRYGRMSNAADVYAFGIMMWELYTGQQAFRRLHYGQFFDIVVRHNLRPSVPDHMPSDYRTLMEHCWATEPADRPTCGTIVECLEYMIQERRVHLQPTALHLLDSGSDAVDQHGKDVDGGTTAAAVGDQVVCVSGPVVSQLRTLMSAGAVASPAAAAASSSSMKASPAAAEDPGVSRHVVSSGAVDAAAAAAGAADMGAGDLGPGGRAAPGDRGDQACTISPKKPHLLFRPAPVRRPRISFGYYGSPAAAAATPQAAAAAAVAADRDNLAGADDQQLYMPINEASTLAITPAATPIQVRDDWLQHQQLQPPAAAAAAGSKHPQAAEAPGKGRRTSLSLFLSQLPAHFSPLFRGQTGDSRRSSSSRRASAESMGGLGDAGSQLSDALPTSFTTQRDDSQASKRSWFV